MRGALPERAAIPGSEHSAARRRWNVSWSAAQASCRGSPHEADRGAAKTRLHRNAPTAHRPRGAALWTLGLSRHRCAAQTSASTCALGRYAARALPGNLMQVPVLIVVPQTESPRFSSRVGHDRGLIPVGGPQDGREHVLSCAPLENKQERPRPTLYSGGLAAL